MLVGLACFFAGHMWEETADLLHFFCDKDFKQELGRKVMKTGAAAFVAGLGLGYVLVKWH